MLSNKIKFAVVGFGHIGQRHVEIIDKQNNTELVAIVDIDENKNLLSNYPKKTPFFSSLDNFFNSQILADVVVIATPNSHHCPQAIQSLDYGCNVVIEKPMGLTKSECENVISKALNVSKQVFVVMQNRYSPPARWMKQIVDKNIMGDILMVNINCYWNRGDKYYAQSGWKGTMNNDGGTLFTQFSHFIDILYWVFGDIKNINSIFKDFCHKNNTEFEDSGVVNFELNGGGLGSINFSTAVWDKNMESSITVLGSKGSFKIGGQYMNTIEYCHIENYDLPSLQETNPPNQYGDYKGSAANHKYTIENVVNTLSGREHSTTNALEGLKVVDIIERIYKTRNLELLKSKR